MPTIKGITYYIGPLQPGAIKPAQGVLLKGKDGPSLCQKFREGLLQHEEKFTIHLDLRPFPPIACNWAKCGGTAGLALWWRGDTTEAITALLSGVNQEDEDMVESILGSGRYPILLHQWHQVLNRPRPTYVTFLISPASLKDQMIPTAAPALAFTFFATLGINNDEDQIGEIE